MPINKKLTYIVFFTLYSVFLFFIYTRNGIMAQNEAEKYVLAAQELSEGNFAYILEHRLFYSSFIFFLTIFSQLGGSYAFVMAQALLSFTAAICLEKTITHITQKKYAGQIGLFLFLFNYPIQIWVLTLFSDFFFVAIITITLYLTVKQKTKTQIVVWAFLLLVLTFARPPGIFLSTLFFFYYLSQSFSFKRKQLLIACATCFVLIFVCLFIAPVSTTDFIKPIASGTIIVEQPDYNITQFNAIDKSSMLSAYEYLYQTNGGLHIIGLYFKKLLSFFTLTRPHYSTLHNSFMIIHYFLYVFSLMGLLFSEIKQLKYLLLFSVFLLANLTAITYNEWHYRFTIAIFPFLIILSSISLSHLYDILHRNKKIS